MRSYLRTVFLYAATQIKRIIRDPVTVMIFIGLPLILLVVFGAFLTTTDDISLDVMVVNESRTSLSADFEQLVRDAEVFEVQNAAPSAEEAQSKLKEGELDALIVLPQEFGTAGDDGIPRGVLTLYYDQTDEQASSVLTSGINALLQEMNQKILGIEAPLKVEHAEVAVHQVPPINNIFAIITGLAVMMVGILGVASSLPSDKKSGALKRLHATPLRESQVILGTTASYSTLSALVILIMTVLAQVLFGLEVHGSWLAFAILMILGILLMNGIGLAIGGIAKNTTQADGISQIVFFASLALGGIWIPRTFMPDIMRTVSTFIPLTPVIEGVRTILNDGATVIQVLPQYGMIGAWMILVFFIGTRTFSWE